MKTNIKQILSITSLAIATTLGVMSCKDEVLVPVKDNTSSDSLVNLITALDKQKITLDKKNNTITITNAILNDSINNLYNAVNNSDREVEFTINLINGGTTITSGDYNGSSSRIKGFNGANVTVTQSGSIGSKTATSAEGRAIFTGLKQGYATVQITAANFAPINATVYLGSDETYASGDGAVRSASSNFLMIPIGGSDGVTIKGNLYINKSILDDTLGRQYNGGGTLQDKYVSNPSKYNYYNFSGYYYSNQQTIYGYTQGNVGPLVKFDALTSDALTASGTVVSAYPNLGGNYRPANVYDAGSIASITYSGLISKAVVDGNGSYTISLPYILNGAADDDISYHIEAPALYSDLKRFNGDGTANVSGSVSTPFKSFNVNTYVTTPITRYVLTENWVYYSAISDDEDGFNYFNSGTLYGNDTAPGATVYRNIYYFPIYQD